MSKLKNNLELKQKLINADHRHAKKPLMNNIQK